MPIAALYHHISVLSIDGPMRYMGHWTEIVFGEKKPQVGDNVDTPRSVNGGVICIHIVNLFL